LESAELERILREGDRRAWEEARSSPIPSVELEPIDWEDPARRRFAEEAYRAYLRLRYLQEEGSGLDRGGGRAARPAPPRRGGPCLFRCISRTNPGGL